MPNSLQKTTLSFSGIPASGGIAIGAAFILKHINLNALANNRFPVDNYMLELERLDTTIKKTHSQLHQMSSQSSSEVSAIIKVQMGILADDNFMHDIAAIVKEEKSNIEYVLSNQIRILEARFATIEDDYMRARILDIQDVYHRILRNLLDIDHVGTNTLRRITSPMVLVAQKLLPSDVCLLNPEKLLGIVLEDGSVLSHVGIMAKSLGIPTVIKAARACSQIKTGDMVVVDAIKGTVIVNPTEKDLELYHAKRERLLAPAPVHDKGKFLTCKTSDGTRINLEANIGSLRDAEEACACHADGIGLLRTELFYMTCATVPTIDEEQEFYTKVASMMPAMQTTVRLLDLGADKLLPFMEVYREDNPQLGMRGIRYLLKNTGMFEKHLTAVLRSCKFNPLKILLPFVTSVADITKTMELLDRICKKEKVDKSMYKLGIMAEIPAVALYPELFFPYIDFINIGTNDLMQYVFAAGREEKNVEEYREQSNPVILSIIKHVIDVADKHSKDISICGEIAADPAVAPVLVGLGAKKLSMQPSSIPLVKKAIHQASIADMMALANNALTLSPQ